MIPEIGPELKKQVLVRLGWHPSNVRGMSEKELNSQLNRLHENRPEAVEFEVLRQVGKAWDSSELTDLPNA